ncbi:exosome catalytic subunit dis3 [Gurleya vavrai]
MIKKIITRSMNQAVYFSSGSVPYEEFFHYGLAMPIYTHFTSPIRRYADLIVHRQLESIIKNENISYDNDKIEDICKNINFRNRSAMYANLDCDKLFTYLYIRDKSIIDFAYITRIRSNGVVCYIPALGIEDTVFVDLEYCEEKNCFFKNGIRVFGLYDYVKVKISGNDEKFFIERHFDIEIIYE